MRIAPALPLLFVMSIAVSACDHHFDSVAQLNEVPLGTLNQTNLAAMVAHPIDLVHGHGVASSDASSSVPAIERLTTDKAKPLLNPGSVSGGSSGG